MVDFYYLVYSDASKKIYWFMKKEAADIANLKAIYRFTKNHKEDLVAEEISLSDKKATKVKSLLATNSMWAAIEIIKKENPNATPIEYPKNILSNFY